MLKHPQVFSLASFQAKSVTSFNNAIVRTASTSFTLFPPAHRTHPVTLSRQRIVEMTVERSHILMAASPFSQSVRGIKLPPQATASGRHAEVAMNDELAARHRAIVLRSPAALSSRSAPPSAAPGPGSTSGGAAIWSAAPKASTT